MAGLAKTEKFMLSTATVMVGPATDMKNFNPQTHSIGLVKNFTLTSEPNYTELTQGVKNTIVASVMTENPVRASMEVYEFTTRNIAYGLGLADADGYSTLTTATAVDGAIDEYASPTPMDLDVVDASQIAINDHIMIKLDDLDNFIVRKVTGVATNNITVDAALPSIPDGAEVLKVNKLEIGSKDDQPYYAAVITGKTANGDAVMIQIPKMRIVRGFSLAFTSQDFGNLPFEFTVYDLVSTDPHYAEFDGAQARYFAQ